MGNTFSRATLAKETPVTLREQMQSNSRAFDHIKTYSQSTASGTALLIAAQGAAQVLLPANAALRQLQAPQLAVISATANGLYLAQQAVCRAKLACLEARELKIKHSCFICNPVFPRSEIQM